MNRSSFLMFLLLLNFCGFSQGFNNSASKSYINIPMPRTPESGSFEKYGTIPVDEYSGTPNISVPLYSVKGKFLEAPLTLAYHASGIKVNQEATWVGLGFDLLTGGRITVETRGNIDDKVRSYFTQQFKEGVKRIFNKWKKPYSPSPNASKLGYAFIDYGKVYGNTTDPDLHTGDTAWDEPSVVSNAAWFGVGEPDIYHAHFMGHSLNFYFDMLTEQVRFIGEKSLFHVVVQRDSYGYLSTFTITDNSGIQYFFEQKERTKLTIPPNYGYNSYTESTSAWLLTKVVHPSGEELVFSYTNFGKTHPAFTWSASISARYPYSGTDAAPITPQNEVEQDPYYLTKIESASTTVELSLSSREDLRGEGARKLDRIDIKDKVSGRLLKQVLFTYDYFTAPLSPFENTLADNIKSYYGKRLKLLSVQEKSGTTDGSTWKFFYNPLQGPSKLSFSQDHWGYYNGANNEYGYHSDPTSPVHLIPRFEDLGNLATRVIGGPLIVDENSDGCDETTISSGQIPLQFNGYAGSRNCAPTHTLAYMMDSIVYPTGGASKFEYEPHRSYYHEKNITDFVGGGLRVKSVKNYTSPGTLENVTEYDYENSGIYLGAIEYIRIAQKWPSGHSITLSSSGELNSDNQTVGYGVVTKTLKDYTGGTNNGYIKKYYNVSSPLPVEYTFVNHPFPYPYGDTKNVDKNFLLKQWSSNAPMPRRELDGKLQKEEILDRSDNLVKATHYYYRQTDFNNDFYSLKVADNYLGKEGVVGFHHFLYSEGCTSGAVVSNHPDYGYGNNNPNSFIRYWRRWEMCLTPAVSFFTVLDSVVTHTYSGGIVFTERQNFGYNKYYQQEYVGTENSDGTQTISYTRTPLSFDHPQIASGGEGVALVIEGMKSSHLYDYPIEQVSLLRNASGDTLVTGGVYREYDDSRLKKAYVLETTTPLSFRTGFMPSAYYLTASSFDVRFDPKYKLQDQAEYYPGNLVKDLTTVQGKKAFLWDEVYGTLLAEATNASSAEIAFTSFESTVKGNWTYAGTPVSDVTAPTGKKVYSLAGGGISRTALDAGKTYMVSYWSKSGAQQVNGAPATAGRSYKGWTYYEHRVVNPSSGSISVLGSGVIDELRLYPEEAQMTTYTHEPLVGLSAQCDTANRIAYYEYDALGRLQLLRDINGQIIKTFAYKYKQ